MKDKEIVLSGIRATGNLHIGNYYGALSKFIKMQDDYDCLYFIADLHALTTNPDPKQLHENVRNILAEYLAAGVDPEKATIFVQSDVPEISEMYLLLNMHVGIGELMRTASFKDKARKQLGITDDGQDIEKQIIGADTNKRDAPPPLFRWCHGSEFPLHSPDTARKEYPGQNDTLCTEPVISHW